MLSSLAIRNIVLIEQCELTLAKGLCVLTGETGAGKSILLDALGLALGARADARLVRKGKDQASVIAEFDITGNEAAHALLTELGLDDSDDIIIRRTLTPDGKTKCYVNDVAVSVTGLKQLGDTLIEIHGQHDGRGLLDPSTHREMLDAYGENGTLLVSVEHAYAAWHDAAKALADTEQAIETAAREKDYLLHMQKELGDVAPEKGEEETLAETRTLMMQSEKLAETLNDVRNELAGGKGAASMVMSAQRILTRSALSAKDTFVPAIEALGRAAEELAEAESMVEKLLDASQYDPHKLEQIEERLFSLRGLARKYNVTVEELSDLLADVNQKLSTLKGQEHQLASLKKAVSETRALYVVAAEKLSRARAKAGKNLEKAVTGELDSLKMAATQFSILVDPLSEDRWSAGGVDNVQFQAATNKGSHLAPLHKIASGGELSRFMLAMKVALAKVKSTPTLIFDEIDTGTGGAVADAIGKRLAALGATHQVLVVTHLPQVAARGDHHLKVMKQEKSAATFTSVEVLSAADRKEELARMLAGAEVTVEARKAAAKLLQAAG
jgi:DNA repair protein RecN (Recombination protein N)